MVLHQTHMPRNLGILQHTCTKAQQNSPSSSFFCHLKASVHVPFKPPHFFAACYAVDMRKKSFITGD